MWRWIEASLGVPDADRPPSGCEGVAESPGKSLSGPQLLVCTRGPRPGAVSVPQTQPFIMAVGHPHASSLEDHEPFAYSCDRGRVPPLGLEAWVPSAPR